jgi:prolyl-tRNA synthetase
MPETKIKKTEDFNEWYNEIVELADLCDKRYPIKGMNVWRPYGWKLMTHVDRMMREEMDKTDHKEVCFPLLIPESLFKKEEEHIEGFGSEVYWVTHAGDSELEERWLLRPTSETAMYPVFSLWIRSHADLPLKTYQIVNTFRYETKQTRAFIRVREIHFFEAHTCHVDFEDAEKQIQEDKDIADRLFKKICLPYLFSKRPDWDKFAGAYYTISIDVLMPSSKTLQLGSIHQYRDNFSKPYEISYEAEDGKHKYCHQTTYGMSERILGALVGIHGDNKGLVLPPMVAPTQVVIIPVIFKGKEKEIMETCETLHKNF